MKYQYLFTHFEGPDKNLKAETLRKIAMALRQESHRELRLKNVVIEKSETFTVTVRIKK